jgi:hypothetical protein
MRIKRMMIVDVQESIERLKHTGRYTYILDHIKTSELTNWPYVFEMLFADEFVLHGLYLDYEANINPSNDKTIDFIYHAEGKTKFLFELVRPEMSTILQSEYDQKMYRDDVDDVMVSSDNANEKLRPEAQTIRLQEKLLEKVEKFPEPDDKNFSVIVVDCSNLHFGHFDDDDARISMYGLPKNPILLERWNGKRILGMLEKNYTKRNALDFQDKITAVVFVPMLQAKKMLNGAKITFNYLRTEQHRILFQSMSNDLYPISHIKWL